MRWVSSVQLHALKGSGSREHQRREGNRGGTQNPGNSKKGEHPLKNLNGMLAFSCVRSPTISNFQ